MAIATRDDAASRWSMERSEEGEGAARSHMVTRQYRRTGWWVVFRYVGRSFDDDDEDQEVVMKGASGQERTLGGSGHEDE